MTAARKPSRKSTKRLGRPPFEPSEEQRRQVMMLRAEGIEPEVIANIIGISEPTLRKYFTADMIAGRYLGMAKNTRRLQEAAQKGNVTAMIWLDKTRYGVREVDAPEPVGKKLQREQEARTAGEGTAWARLLQGPLQ